MKKLISIFGPSECAAGGSLYREAERAGALLAGAGFAVVTGGYEGIMEAVSKGAHSCGGRVIGVTAEVYGARGRQPNIYLSKEVRVKSAVDQLMELIDIPDAYLAIGTSTGTLIEVMVAWDYTIKRFIAPKPLLLVGPTWERFLSYVKSEPQFQQYLDIIEHHPTVEDAVAQLQTIFGAELALPELTIIDPRETNG